MALSVYLCKACSHEWEQGYPRNTCPWCNSDNVVHLGNSVSSMPNVKAVEQMVETVTAFNTPITMKNAEEQALHKSGIYACKVPHTNFTYYVNVKIAEDRNSVRIKSAIRRHNINDAEVKHVKGTVKFIFGEGNKIRYVLLYNCHDITRVQQFPVSNPMTIGEYMEVTWE